MHFTLVIHEFAVCACLAQHELLSEAVEDLADMAGPTSVEAKRELIEITLEMLGADFSLMGCTKPSLEQRGNEMDMREDLDSKHPISLGMSNPVLEPRLCHTLVTVPSIGVNPRSRLHELGDKADQAVTRRIGDVTQAYSPNLAPAQLYSDNDQGFTAQFSTVDPLFNSTDVSFINLHCTREMVPPHSNHGLPQLLKQQPCGTIASQPKCSLEPSGAQSRLLSASQPHGHEPTPERHSCLVQDRASRQRCLPFARGAENRRSRRRPAVVNPTRRAYEPLRPPKVAQVFAARLVGRKPIRKLHDGAREQVVHTRRTYQKAGLE